MVVFSFYFYFYYFFFSFLMLLVLLLLLLLFKRDTMKGMVDREKKFLHVFRIEITRYGTWGDNYGKLCPQNINAIFLLYRKSI